MSSFLILQLTIAISTFYRFFERISTKGFATEDAVYNFSMEGFRGKCWEPSNGMILKLVPSK